MWYEHEIPTFIKKHNFILAFTHYVHNVDMFMFRWAASQFVFGSYVGAFYFAPFGWHFGLNHFAIASICASIVAIVGNARLTIEWFSGSEAHSDINYEIIEFEGVISAARAGMKAPNCKRANERRRKQIGESYFSGNLAVVCAFSKCYRVER